MNTDTTLALFQAPDTTLATTGFNEKELVFLKEQEPDFHFENAKPIYTKKDTYHVSVTRGGQCDFGNIRSLYGPCVAAWEDGAVRVPLGKWRRGLISMTTSTSGHPLCELLFAYRQRWSPKLWIVILWVQPHNLSTGFVETPEKLTKGFRLTRRIPSKDPQSKYWPSDYSVRNRYGNRRIPAMLLLQENWAFNPKLYTKELFPKPDEKAAVEIKEHPGSKHFSLVSNGKGTYMLLNENDYCYMRRNGKLTITINNGKVTSQQDLLWHRDAKEHETITTTAGQTIDPTFESYILHH